MYNIWIPSNRPELAKETKKCFLPYEVNIYDGFGYKSFSKLINHCIINSVNETVIIISDKVRGNSKDIDKMLKLLDEGYGMVCLYLFAFFGFKKDLIRKVGWLDERFIGGGWEDADYVRRMKESNIGFYYEKEIPILKMKTSWDYCDSSGNSIDLNSPARLHYLNKWNEGVSITRNIKEEIYLYDIGDYQKSIFLDFSKTIYHKEFIKFF